MAGLFDKQADLYLDARPNYPSEWFSKLADLTDHHGLAWDAATGNGQAALAVCNLKLMNFVYNIKSQILTDLASFL